jgi:hypothetical protein
MGIHLEPDVHRDITCPAGLLRRHPYPILSRPPAMAATSIIALADLIGDACRQRLEALLAPKVAVTVQCAGHERLPVAFLAIAVQSTAAAQGFLRLDGLTTFARNAVTVVDPTGVLAVGEAGRTSKSGERPFTVTIDAEGRILIRAHPGICQHPRLAEPISYDWARGLGASAVVVDLTEVEHLSSLLVAWLLQIGQAVAPLRVGLTKVSRQAAAQLSQLRLNHLLTVG